VEVEASGEQKEESPRKGNWRERRGTKGEGRRIQSACSDATSREVLEKSGYNLKTFRPKD